MSHTETGDAHASGHADWKLGDPPIVHHMDSHTAYDAARLGMWLFLATEVLLFGGLFAAYLFYHWMYFAEFHHASKGLNWQLGTLNTGVLLFSSYLAVMAVDAIKQGKNDRAYKFLISTIGCGFIFLIIKAFEYYHKFELGLFPGLSTFNSVEHQHEYKMFFGLYFCMTALHALHVILGMGLLLWGALKVRSGRLSARYYTPVEVGALYWHLVDLIWIYLFPLLYLVG